MSSSESNPLRQALAKGAVAGPHPDADILTALAEGALMMRERRAVLDHLTACAQCRQVLAMATDAVPAPATPSRPRWWQVRVLAPTLAAVVVVAAVSMWVVRLQRGLHQQQSAMAAKPAEAPRIQPPQPATQAPSNATDERKTEPRPPAATVPRAKTPTAPQIGASLGSMGSQAQIEAAPAPEPVPPPSTQQVAPAPGQETAQAEQSVGSQQGRSQGLPQASAVSQEAAPGVTQGGPVALKKLKPGADINAFSNTVTSEALRARAPLARPHWRINAQGQPERAFSGGSWQPVLPNGAAKMRVLSVFGGEVWVGGEKAQVFRSFDNGETWRLVPLPEKHGTDHAIAHIRFHSAMEITVEATDGMTWTTADGGATWN